MFREEGQKVIDQNVRHVWVTSGDFTAINTFNFNKASKK